MNAQSKGVHLKSHLYFAMLVLVLLVSGCNGETPAPPPLQDSGPQTWVEFPYDGTTLPMEPVTLVIYSTDPAGLVQIKVSINGSSLPILPVSPMTTDGSTHLARIDQSWQPPGEGEYLVEAFGVSANGTAGKLGTTRFCIVNCQTAPGIAPAEVVPTFTPTTETVIVGTDTPTTEPPPPTEEVNISFYASPPYVDAGYCTSLHWDVTGSNTVYFDGEAVYTQGTRERCPCETESHNIQAIKPGGGTEERWVTIDVYGSCASPQPTEPPAPSDTTGPSYDTGYLIWENCKFYGVTELTDPSGISWAKFGYNLNDEGWLWVWMMDTGSQWQSEIGVSVMDGIGTPIGDIQFQFQSSDTLGNESYSGIYPTYSYTSCDG